VKEDPGSPGQVSLDRRSIIPYKWVKEKDMTYGLKRNVKKVKEDDKKINKKFFNCLLNICIVNAVIDWSDKDPKKEFQELGELISVYMIASGIEVDLND